MQLLPCLDPLTFQLQNALQTSSHIGEATELSRDMWRWCSGRQGKGCRCGMLKVFLHCKSHPWAWQQQLLTHHCTRPAPEVQRALLVSTTLLHTLRLTPRAQISVFALPMVLSFRFYHVSCSQHTRSHRMVHTDDIRERTFQ